MAEGKVVRWHRIPFMQFVSYEASRPMFRPFLIGAAYVLRYAELLKKKKMIASML